MDLFGSTNMKLTSFRAARELNTRNADGAPPELPPELHGVIIELVIDLPLLASLCLVSKTFQCFAERQLYASVGKLTRTRADDLDRYHTLFLTTINTNARLAALVRAYHITCRIAKKNSHFWYLLKSGLKKMANLKYFDYFEVSGLSSGRLFHDVSFKLDTLVWNGTIAEKCMKKALTNGQSGLNSLFSSDSNTAMSFPGKACPNLKTLCGSNTLIEVLLPGRRVEEVSILPLWNDGHHYHGRVEGLQEALSQVKKLSMRGYFWRPSMVSDNLSSIEVLGLSKGIFHEKVLEIIQRFKTLRILIAPVNDKSSDEVIALLFNELPLLHSIYTEFTHTIGHPQLFNQWGRNKSDGTSPLKVGVVADVLRTFFTFH